MNNLADWYTPLSAGTTVFLLSASLLQGFLLFLQEREGASPHRITALRRLREGLLTASALSLSALLIIRSLRWNYPALGSTYGALLLFILAAAVTTVILLRRQKPSEEVALLLIAVIIVFWLLASSPLIDSADHPPLPALQSRWLVLHIAMTLAGEGLFLAGTVTSLFSLFPPAPGRDPEGLERTTYRLILLGYPLYTAGALLFGALWAYYAWGRFWGWDPKEVWALVTWLVYTFYLHQRITLKGRSRPSGQSGKEPCPDPRGIPGRPLSRGEILLRLLPLIGFLTALFTFFGVNYLLGGLHSY